MKRRNFMRMLSGAALYWPIAARAQQVRPVRRIGVLTNLAADDSETESRVGAFVNALAELGWTEGQNVRFEFRWGVGNTDRYSENAVELVGLAPDVILAHGSAIVGPLLRATKTVPIVFVSVADPVAGGIVGSLARPGRNATGFTTMDYGLSGKWLDLLKQIAPQTKRVAVLRDPRTGSGTGQLGAIQAVAQVFGLETLPVDVRDVGVLERDITAFAHEPNGGLIMTDGSTLAYIHRARIIALAARTRLPAVYPYRFLVAGGGLICYGPDQLDQYRRAASYVDRILRGEKPSELPVQAPTKFDLVVNLKTAKALDLVVPDTLLVAATEVIE